MKALLFSAMIGLIVLPLAAQTTTTTTSTTSTTSTTTASPAPANPMLQQALATLTPDEKNELLDARTKALADNPGLETEGMGLMEKGMMLQSGTASAEDRKAFEAAARDYKDRMQAAMIKADPAVQHILAKLEAEGARMQVGSPASP